MFLAAEVDFRKKFLLHYEQSSVCSHQAVEEIFKIINVLSRIVPGMHHAVGGAEI
jgi:hypothetical protein